MGLSDVVYTFGRYCQDRFGERVHKLAIDAGFTCPNRDGTKGRGGCTFCNNASFSPNAHRPDPVAEQMADGIGVIRERVGASRFLAYFQSYTNTYGDVSHLRSLYESALQQPGVVGLAVGTRPDCAPPEVLDLLAGYRDQGWEIWLELGLQTVFDETQRRVNRGHGFAEYQEALRGARDRGLSVCTHLILGLPGEEPDHYRETLDRVLAEGVDGLKLHPLHIVRGTRLAHAWRRGEYRPLELEEYVTAAADLIERTPGEVVYHRVTGTASPDILLAPEWCGRKWAALNAIEKELRARGGQQGSALRQPAEVCHE